MQTTKDTNIEASSKTNPLDAFTVPEETSTDAAGGFLDNTGDACIGVGGALFTTHNELGGGTGDAVAAAKKK